MRFILVALFIPFSLLLKSQSFYDVNTIQDIHIYFGYTNWDYRLDTAYAGAEDYIQADSVVINGVALGKCGVRFKGNSSYDVNRAKNPLHIKLDEYVNQNYQGYEDIKLGNGYSDNSMIREPLSYAILRNYMDAPQSNFARVYINNAYYGIMNNTESIDSRFLLDKYYSSNRTFIKCNPIGSPGVGNGSNLGYNGTNEASYNTVYELKSDTGWSELFQLCDTLNNHFTAFNSIADIDRFLWMLAFNNALVNLDSYSGTFRQNYYLYRNHAGQWIPTIWDLNMSFGGFAIAGGITSNLTPTTMQTMSYTLHKTETAWPLINKLLNDTVYSKMYYAHLRTINNENFSGATYKTMADTMHALVDAAVLADTNYLGTYTDFQNSLTANTTIAGSGAQCPGLYTLMDGRANYLANVLSATAPAITNVSNGNAIAFGNTTTVTAQVVNSTQVYLGYRYSKKDRFARVPMFDDGAHNDGAANDNVFGAPLLLNSLGVQYYIYAQNSNTGSFSPERAEYEFYTINPTIATAGGSQVVINEVAPNNNTGIENENGKFKDWLELYNTTNQPLGLSGLYLTGTTADLTKWNFPDKALIMPNEHLLVWADDLDKTYLDLHANFNLNALGDALLLTDGTTVLDSVSFDAQSANTGIGRCTDGTGNFATVYTLTPRAVNDCSTAINELSKLNIALYPNPAAATINIQTTEAIKTIELFSLNGELLKTITARQIDVSTLSAGCYLLKVTAANNSTWRSKFIKL